MTFALAVIAWTILFALIRLVLWSVSLLVRHTRLGLLVALAVLICWLAGTSRRGRAPGRLAEACHE